MDHLTDRFIYFIVLYLSLKVTRLAVINKNGFEEVKLSASSKIKTFPEST